MPTAHRPIRFVLSGPESSGKSTLAAALAQRFQIPHAPEYARIHLENNQPYPESPAELVELARQHLAWQTKHVPATTPCAIYDTDMLNYLIWADVSFGTIPHEISTWLNAETHHIHLLCQPDIPWQPDPHRQHPDIHQRQQLAHRHARELQQRGIRHHLIHGHGQSRLETAATHIRNHLP